MKLKIKYWLAMRPIKKEYKRIGKELEKISKELDEAGLELASLLSGGSSDPLPAGSGSDSITKENHVANIS